MSINIRTKSGKLFKQVEGESILSSAEKAEVYFQYSCKTGRCSSCKCKLISGKVKNYADQVGLDEEEKSQGYILSCVTYAIENIELEVDDLGDIKLPKPVTLPCKIDSINKISNDILILTLRTPPNSNINFIPGQYFNMIGPEGLKRSYSIANNIQNGLIELHIKRVSDGLFSEYWFEKSKINDLLRLNGPHGTFFLKENNKKLIFLATGTGIAPIKSILDSIEDSPADYGSEIYLIWGGRNISDLYIDFSDKYKNINLKYIPVLSQINSKWTGEIGYVQEILLKMELDLSNYAVYACGLDNMISDSKKLLVENGLNENNFYSDAFVASSDIMEP